MFQILGTYLPGSLFVCKVDSVRGLRKSLVTICSKIPDSLSKIELYITPPLKGHKWSTAEILDWFLTFTRINSVHVEMNE